MPVLVSRSSIPASPIGTAAIKARAERMLKALRLERAELSLMLCDDATMHALNRSHRKKDKPTDVLAFALREGPTLPGAGDLLGDVVISIDTARRQARERGHPLWAEVTTLLAHGLLHLVGYDHRTDAEERRMNARADVLIAAASARATATKRGAVAKKKAAGGSGPAKKAARRAPGKSSTTARAAASSARRTPKSVHGRTRKSPAPARAGRRG